MKYTQSYGLVTAKRTQQKFRDTHILTDANDWKSTSGYMFKVSGAVVIWGSKKQTCIALSTAASSVAQEAIWMRQLFTDLKNGPSSATVIYEDNQSTISFMEEPSTLRSSTTLYLKNFKMAQLY